MAYSGGGATSPPLGSNTQRQRQHRHHLAATSSGPSSCCTRSGVYLSGRTTKPNSRPVLWCLYPFLLFHIPSIVSCIAAQPLSSVLCCVVPQLGYYTLTLVIGSTHLCCTSPSLEQTTPLQDTSRVLAPVKHSSTRRQCSLREREESSPSKICLVSEASKGERTPASIPERTRFEKHNPRSKDLKKFRNRQDG